MGRSPVARRVLHGPITSACPASLLRTHPDAQLTVAVNENALSEVTPVKLAIGVLMIAFALFELLPRFRKLEFDRRWLPLGGLLSGFFGGLSGHQGALRSAFLAKTGLTTERFVGSNAVIGFLVDLTRIAVYVALFAAVDAASGGYDGVWGLVITGSLAAFCGVLLGKRYLHKVTMRSIQTLVGLLLFGAAIEFCQYLVGYREADWIDMAANMFGIVLGFAAAIAGLGGWSLRVENWYATRNAGTRIG